MYPKQSLGDVQQQKRKQTFILPVNITTYHILWAHLSPFGLVFAVFGEQMAEYVGTAARHMDQRSLLPQAEAGGDG